MQTISSTLQDILNNQELIYVKPKVEVEFGSNRFNDGQIVIAQSTKLTRTGFSQVGSPPQYLNPTPSSGYYGDWSIVSESQVITDTWTDLVTSESLNAAPWVNFSNATATSLSVTSGQIARTARDIQINSSYDDYQMYAGGRRLRGTFDLSKTVDTGSMFISFAASSTTFKSAAGESFILPDAHGVELDFVTNTIKFYSDTGASATPLGSATDSINYTFTNAEYRFEIDYSMHHARYRFWLASETYPTSWDYEEFYQITEYDSLTDFENVHGTLTITHGFAIGLESGTSTSSITFSDMEFVPTRSSTFHAPPSHISSNNNGTSIIATQGVSLSGVEYLGLWKNATETSCQMYWNHDGSNLAAYFPNDFHFRTWMLQTDDMRPPSQGGYAVFSFRGTSNPTQAYMNNAYSFWIDTYNGDLLLYKISSVGDTRTQLKYRNIGLDGYDWATTGQVTINVEIRCEGTLIQCRAYDAAGTTPPDDWWPIEVIDNTYPGGSTGSAFKVGLCDNIQTATSYAAKEWGILLYGDHQTVGFVLRPLDEGGSDSVPAPPGYARFWRAEDVFNNKNFLPTKWLVCDSGATVKATADGTGYRAVSLKEDDFERGWWSQVQSGSDGSFVNPMWIQSTWTTPRYVDTITLHTMKYYPNMKTVRIEYRDTNLDWIMVDHVTLGETEYEKIFSITGTNITGLKATVFSTWVGNDYARLSELNATYTTDISDQVVSFNINTTREEYEGTVPIGTTAANTFDMELSNVDGRFNLNGDGSFPYHGYLTADNKFTISVGISTVYDADGTPSTNELDLEWIKLGEFYSDDWSNDTDTMTARVNGRDFSKFLQDELLYWGGLWQDTTAERPIREILTMMGVPEDKIIVDTTGLRRFSMLFTDRERPWEFLGEVAFADQGMFGFTRNNEFKYDSYSTLDRAPHNTSVWNLSPAVNISRASIKTELYVNKVSVKVSPYDLTKVSTNPLWQCPSPTILSWARLGTSISSSATVIPITIAPRQTSASLTTNGWAKRGYLFLPKFSTEIRGGVSYQIVTGGELIKYNDRTENAFTGCQRGYLGTSAQAWAAGTYIGEARKFDMEFDNAPAISVKFPYVTAIDTLRTDAIYEGQEQAHVIHFESDAFRGKMVIGNIANYYTWLAGTGQTLKDIDNTNADAEITFATSVAGDVAIQTGTEVVDETVENPKGQNNDLIRRYGKNEIEIDNQWIQTVDHAQAVVDIMIGEYKYPRQIVELNTIGLPHLELADRVTLINLDQLDINNLEGHIISHNIAYDGGLTSTMRVRAIGNATSVPLPYVPPEPGSGGDGEDPSVGFIFYEPFDGSATSGYTGPPISTL